MATYTRSSDHPVQHPVLTGVLAQIVAAESAAEGRRETAFPTLVRYSDAGKCARAIALERLVPEGEQEVDIASAYVMWLGRLIHEHVQSAIVETYGGIAEKTSRIGDLCAGHADWTGIIADTELGKICYELKTEGAYAFDKAVGLNRKSYTRKNPEGPKASARIQGALNAVANDCDTLIIGVLSMQAVSIQLAEKVDYSELDRICGEWHYSRAEFSPWAELEVERARIIEKDLEEGLFPLRMAIGDEMEPLALEPEKVNHDTGQPRQWQCVYCRVKDACIRLGPDPVRLSEIEAPC